MSKELEKKQPTEVVVISDSGAIMSIIERAASDPNTDIEKMERLLAMHERILERNAAQEYANSMNQAQGKMRAVSQDASNSQTHSKYATYTALDKVLRPIYVDHGFSIEYDTEPSPHESEVIVVAKVSHTSGHTETRRLPMPCDGKGAKGNDVMTKTHATMSAITYGRRGLLKMIFNIAEGEDDDGNLAGSPPIDDETKQEIIRLIKETGTDTALMFSKVFPDGGITAVDQLTVRTYGPVVNGLKARKKKQEEDAANADS